MSQAALQTALDELDSAKKMLKWSSEKLIEAQQENKKLCNVLISIVENPDPVDCLALLKKLDRPCGFVECELTKEAARVIRSLSTSNEYLREENKRLRNANNSR